MKPVVDLWRVYTHLLIALRFFVFVALHFAEKQIVQNFMGRFFQPRAQKKILSGYDLLRICVIDVTLFTALFAVSQVILNGGLRVSTDLIILLDVGATTLAAVMALDIDIESERKKKKKERKGSKMRRITVALIFLAFYVFSRENMPALVSPQAIYDAFTTRKNRSKRKHYKA